MTFQTAITVFMYVSYFALVICCLVIIPGYHLRKISRVNYPGLTTGA